MERGFGQVHEDMLAQMTQSAPTYLSPQGLEMSSCLNSSLYSISSAILKLEPCPLTYPKPNISITLRYLTSPFSGGHEKPKSKVHLVHAPSVPHVPVHLFTIAQIHTSMAVGEGSAHSVCQQDACSSAPCLPTQCHLWVSLIPTLCSH